MPISLRPLFAGPSRLTLILLAFCGALSLYAAFFIGPAKGLILFLILGAALELVGWVLALTGDKPRE